MLKLENEQNKKTGQQKASELVSGEQYECSINSHSLSPSLSLTRMLHSTVQCVWLAIHSVLANCIVLYSVINYWKNLNHSRLG